MQTFLLFSRLSVLLYVNLFLVFKCKILWWQRWTGNGPLKKIKNKLILKGKEKRVKGLNCIFPSYEQG